MTLNILQVGELVLRQAARELTVAEILSDPIQQLIESMIQTMHAAPGVGLAAPQIGESLQIVVIEDKPEYSAGVPLERLVERQRTPVPLHVLINPKLHYETLSGENESGGEHSHAKFFEGCLSFAGFVGLVQRHLSVRVTALNEKAEPVTINAQGWYARILQHEIDHLHGKLCLDRMPPRSVMTVENYSRYWVDKSVVDICEELGV